MEQILHKTSIFFEFFERGICMTIKDLLPVLPKYGDNSGYDVVINYVSEFRTWPDARKGTQTQKYYDHISLNNEKAKDMMDCEVKEIKAGRLLAGGDCDESLQLWLETEDFARHYIREGNTYQLVK